MVTNSSHADASKYSFYIRYKNGEFDSLIEEMCERTHRKVLRRFIDNYYTFEEHYKKDAVAGREKLLLAEQLAELVELLLLFCFDELIPFARTALGQMQQDSSSWNTFREYFFLACEIHLSICKDLTISLEGSVNRDPSAYIIAKRYHSGLLRGNQVYLLRIATDSYVQQIRGLIRIELEDTTGRVNYWVLNWALQDFYLLLLRFLCSDRFRSERLEVLLLKYLEEPEINMEVYRGVSRCNWEAFRRSHKAFERAERIASINNKNNPAFVGRAENIEQLKW
ncbi:hypothetical protein BJ508DRAFT_312680 [Ascobolus immersus RN42]|uniref:Uncharacterized protein n=1 Tax=Ascobolus immersus RN42 TaxID=1160509 RepID=A0A3N4HLJ6_ASCIM|nr:hypothetical protein BJ508DRAFT_312680 [Ascobolus immersus RN42]